MATPPKNSGPRPRSSARGDEARDGPHVRERAQHERPASPKRRGSSAGPPSRRTLVLQRVEHVEAEEPRHHGEHQEHDAGARRRAACEPRAAGRERERDAEPRVRGPREALRERVAEQDREHERREHHGPAPSVAASPRNAAPETSVSASASPALHLAARDVARLRARVLRVDVAVGPAVERHRARARRRPCSRASRARGASVSGSCGHCRARAPRRRPRTASRRSCARR